MVKVAVAVALEFNPVLNPFAFIVFVEETIIAPEYIVDVEVGIDSSVVYLIVAPLVAHDICTL